jgi:dihydroxyacetone kinase
MTSVLNDPNDFAGQALRGFVLAHQGLVASVPGGVVRRDRPARRTVAVVTGGGSGHYPAFCGWVGPGLADGAAVGDVFASPSTEQICSVARAADNGAGILLSYGNYAGDVLNFTAAQRRLEAEGFAVANLPICDDVTSASALERHKRRGTAGDLVVLKAAGWAAAHGRGLAEVTALAERAEQRTFSFGIAFAGCTLPGDQRPLFSLQPGQMGVGMGVHGEPGVSEGPIVPARELAQTLVDRLLEERPEDGGPAVLALLNGLGATGHEELHVLWGDVYDSLAAAGVAVAACEVDELITSLDMSGVSLTLCWLDDELLAAWQAPCWTAGYSRGPEPDLGEERRFAGAAPAAPAEAAPHASGQSVALAGQAADLAQAVLEALLVHEDELGRLDAVAGDGDHGRGMVRGARAAAAAAATASGAGRGLGDTVAAAGEAWAADSGGTSGALWGAALTAAGRAFGNEQSVGRFTILAAVTAARNAIVELGGAEMGDKTMLDALEPFLAALARHWNADPEDLAGGWRAAAAVAGQAAEATAQLVARRGRARPLGERGLGHPDPGAVSLALILSRLGEADGN